MVQDNAYRGFFKVCIVKLYVPAPFSNCGLLPDSIWLLYFVNAMQSSILYNLIPYVTSDFSSHSLINVIYIVASAITAAVYIPLAKIVDVFGRAEGFLLMCSFATLGLILMAACNNLPTFCAAYVSFHITISDTTC